MVRFNNDKLAIEIKCISRLDAIEKWKSLHSGILDLMFLMDKDTLSDDSFRSIVELLIEMALDSDETAKMIEE
jgi:hypothetical protein